MTYQEFKRKVKKAYDGIEIAFSSNGAQHSATIDDCLTLVNNAESEAVYGKMNGVSIGRCIGIES